MKILITGASSNVSRGIIPRLKQAGHELRLHDIVRLPDKEPFTGLHAVQGDIQAGIGLERAAHSCDMIIHTPAWHGIHWQEKTEADFWRLNVDGTFWMFQAAVAAGIKRVVFLSSMAWHGHYDKYGFTKQIGEELCEYNRRRHHIRYISIRPHDFTPWGNNYVNNYGARLLYGGVDREDVMKCIELAVLKLTSEPVSQSEPEGFVVNALRPNAFTEADIADWEAHPLSACERIFPGSWKLVEKYDINIQKKPSVLDPGAGAAKIGYEPKHHFGTFLDNLRKLDSESGSDAIKTMHCPY